MNLLKLSSVISKFGNDYIDVNDHEIRYQCPRCRELGKTYEDYKLYVNTDTGAFWCHRCEYTGYINLDGKQSNTDIYNLKEYKNFISNEIKSKTMFKLPDKKLYKHPDTLAYHYMLSRGISESDMRYYDIRYVSLLDHDYETCHLAGRVIIPNQVIDFEYTDLYTARTYVNDEKRYYNPYSSYKNQIVFNLHRIKDRPHRVIINEGVLNSIIAGKESVAVYGKHVSDDQLSLILDKKPEEIVISLDTDAIQIAYKLANRIRRVNSNIKLKVLELPDDKDAVDLGRDKYLELIENTEYYGNKLNYYIKKFLGGKE